MKKVVKILGAILLALLSLLCICIIIGEARWLIDYYRDPEASLYSPTPMSFFLDGIVVLIGILSAVGAKKLIFPKKTTELDLDEEAAAEAEKRKIRRRKTIVLIVLYSLLAIVIIGGIVLIAAIDKPCIIGKHNHYGKDVVRESTCSVPGEAIVVCTMCSKEFNTISLPLDSSAHNWGEFEVVTEASGCNISGEQVRTCKACGEQESEEIKPPLEHEYGEWEFEGRNETKFRYISTCTKCGAEGFKYEDRHKVKCKLCNGTGSVKYNYGSSDLEAILSGHDPYTFGPCSSCDGTGKAYADYPWE